MIKAAEITNKEYRNAEGISASDLKSMAISFATYRYYKDNPTDKDSQALLFGRAYHKAILEPSTFNDEFAVMQDFNCGTKEGKQAFIEYVEDVVGRPLTDDEKKRKDSILEVLHSSGKDFISQDDYETIFEMQKVLYSTPYAKKLLLGEHEKSYFWTDKKSGVKCKVRPDSWGKIGDRHIIVDLKTTKNAETEAFIRDSINLGYDIQAAHYLNGMETLTGEQFTFVFVAQEKKPPYLVNILQADDYFIKSGNDVRDSLLEDYKECVTRNEWKGLMGFSNEASINSLGVPKWLQKAYESEVQSETESV